MISFTQLKKAFILLSQRLSVRLFKKKPEEMFRFEPISSHKLDEELNHFHNDLLKFLDKKKHVPAIIMWAEAWFLIILSFGALSMSPAEKPLFDKAVVNLPQEVKEYLKSQLIERSDTSAYQ